LATDVHCRSFRQCQYKIFLRCIPYCNLTRHVSRISLISLSSLMALLSGELGSSVPT
jgi:hypothetical protein